MLSCTSYSISRLVSETSSKLLQATSLLSLSCFFPSNHPSISTGTLMDNLCDTTSPSENSWSRPHLGASSKVKALLHSPGDENRGVAFREKLAEILAASGGQPQPRPQVAHPWNAPDLPRTQNAGLRGPCFGQFSKTVQNDSIITFAHQKWY